MRVLRHGALARTVAVFFAVLAVTLGLSVQADAAETVDDPGGLTGLTFTSVNSGRNLDLQNGNTGDGVFIVTNSAPGYHQKWTARLQADGSFTLANDVSGKCVQAGLPLTQRPCSGSSGQRWYFQPVNGADDTFMIRNAGDDKCIDVVLASQSNDAWTDTYGCNGTAAQQWRIPSSGTDAAFSAAVTYASHRCQTKAATCSWTKGSQAPAEPLPKQCVSPGWYNGTEAPVPWTFSLTTTSGWSSELSVSFQSTVGATSPVQASVTSTITGRVTYNLSEALGNSLVISVPSHQYGWVALSELATKVTGEWTFDAGGYPWTAHDTVTVPLLSDDQGRASIYLVETSPEPPTCGG
ncbi:ricin-type beta-trefoil lectin domain protein [Streptomyces luomodiensis]|uniref:Ricin-type beta-trefoil lectin domain protein n=1 Tax=Streptomyces luomodiensis TaxID=3026192 RepID=A0ABY9V7V2_9ACTN|nr:RICIN domain-containing protein [Streptomyces sp. SCA4-21]WNF00978.1 ricin-type beta-trefoil lectin domain protein [Streptomyces sp. SCA4-21]